MKQLIWIFDAIKINKINFDIFEATREKNINDLRMMVNVHVRLKR